MLYILPISPRNDHFRDLRTVCAKDLYVMKAGISIIIDVEIGLTFSLMPPTGVTRPRKVIYKYRKFTSNIHMQEQ